MTPGEFLLIILLIGMLMGLSVKLALQFEEHVSVLVFMYHTLMGKIPQYHANNHEPICDSYFNKHTFHFHEAVFKTEFRREFRGQKEGGR